MANLRDIKKRIVSTTSTKQITRTMEMVSSAKIRKAFARIESANPYADSMREMLISLTDGASANDHPLLSQRDEVKHVTLITVVSDRGLAGGFNTSVLNAADKARRAYIASGASVDVIVCGKKGIGYFNYREVQPALTFMDLSADPTITQAREISSYVREKFAKGETDKVELFYNHARNLADQDLMTIDVLPISAGKKRDEEKQDDSKKATPMSFEFEPSPEAVLGKLLPDYVDTMIYRALLDSAAAEQGARRRAMKSATDNATEIISTLQRSYNRARQAAITTELTEIVGGAAALEEE